VENDTGVWKKLPNWSPLLPTSCWLVADGLPESRFARLETGIGRSRFRGRGDLRPSSLIAQ
jgi:hypothetical protein